MECLIVINGIHHLGSLEYISCGVYLILCKTNFFQEVEMLKWVGTDYARVLILNGCFKTNIQSFTGGETVPKGNADNFY